MPAFVRIDLREDLACNGGALLGTLYEDDLSDAHDVLAIEDQEGLSFSTSRVDALGGQRAFVTNLRARTIASVVWDDGSFDERRVATIDDGRGNRGIVTVSANPLNLDLADAADSSAGKGFVSTVSNCLRVFDFTVVGKTATEIIDDYVIPNCPSWVTRGTIDPTIEIPTLVWDRLTPWGLVLAVRDTLRRMNVTCEVRLRRNGTTDYKLDLVTQIGSDATVPLFHPASSLKSLARRVDVSQQATRLFVTGESDPSGFGGIPGRARWRIASITSLVVELEDPNGGAGPIGMTGQWVDAFLVRVLTGRSFEIQASDADDQTVTLLDVSNMAVGEFVELRLTEPLTNTRVSANPSVRYDITAVGGSGESITMTGNPITSDGQYRDWYARVWTASVGGTVRVDIRVTGSTSASDVITCASGAASAVQLTDYVEFVQLDGAGEIPSYLDHATYVQAPPTGYGVKCRDLPVSNAHGVTQLLKNGWLRDWANGSNPPDGWTLITGGGAGPTSRNTNTDFVRYGPYSYQVDFNNNNVQTPRFDVVLAPGNTRISARLQIYFTAFTGANNLRFGIFALNAAGAVTGAPLASKLVAPVGGGGGTVDEIATGAWATLEIFGLDLAMHDAPYGMAIQIDATTAPSTGQVVAYIDTVEVFGFVDNPDEETIYEFGDATALHQVANRQLVSNGSPPISYELSIADLERADPTTFARNKLTIGGNVRVFDSDFGIDTTVRLLRLERDLLRPKASQLALSTLPALLTQLG